MFTGTFDDIWIKVLCAALILKVILAIAGILHVVLTLVRADHTDGSWQEVHLCGNDQFIYFSNTGN